MVVPRQPVHVVVEEHRHEHAGRGTLEGVVDGRQVVRRELAVGVDEPPVVGRGRVDPHQVEPVVGLGDHPPAHEQAAGVLADPVVVPRHHREPLGDGGGEAAEGGQLVELTAVGDVAGHHHVVDLGLHQRGHGAAQAGGLGAGAAEVKVREMRERPDHVSS